MDAVLVGPTAESALATNKEAKADFVESGASVRIYALIYMLLYIYIYIYSISYMFINPVLTCIWRPGLPHARHAKLVRMLPSRRRWYHRLPVIWLTFFGA